MMNEQPILLVEDNPFDLDLAIRALTRRNLNNSILVARDGEEALNYLSGFENGEVWPSVILLDINLPKVNGLDVLRAFKTHEKLKAIPIVMLTTSDELRDIKDALYSGANSYIVKPVDYEVFIQIAAQIETYWCGLNKSMISDC